MSCPDDTPISAVAPVTAVHIGASSVSMLVAQKGEDGRYTPVDFLEQPAPLARDIFRHGSIGRETTERIVEILNGFVSTAREYGARIDLESRAVATNILVEADNHERFLNRVRIACGLEINPIDDGEMTRLIYLKTRRRLLDTPPMKRKSAMVLHVGPGNTRALLFEDGAIRRYTSYRLGAHRTREAIEGSHNGGEAMLRVIRENASGNLAQLRFDYHDVKVSTLVMIGYELQQVRHFLTDRSGSCSPKTLRRVSGTAAEMSDLELVQHFQTDYQSAEALVPAIETNLAIAEALGVEDLHIPASDYEQGLLQDILVSNQLTDSLDREVLRSARILASRFLSDANHGEHVSRISLHLFDQLTDLHRLSPHDRLLLEVAAILHEVGTFISPRAHHKHSEYIILNSEIFGLDRRDVTVIALVARYHRHSGPRLDHPAYRELAPADRILVSKLAAILRVADALERTHNQRVHDIETRRHRHRLHLVLPGVSDVAVERLAMESKGDLFEQVFGLEVVIADPA
ncbi:HD domain-containing protein [Haloferula sp. A504]|uniref:Ppx/GppA phosphatase family protein n=1 Tax=Haloferula sp. A504 TaxID=3373601 RepID=UPI0031BD6F18|nr:HD domain-containing protein [Verrucomicrobiaceae bacterium E54]